MKHILNTFFQSDSFWQSFKLVKEKSDEHSYSAHYRFKTEYRNILLKFFELQSVKSVTILSEGKVIVDLIYFLNLDELTLILSRVAEIRAANPLCSGSLSIKALSCLPKTEN